MVSVITKGVFRTIPTSEMEVEGGHPKHSRWRRERWVRNSKVPPREESLKKKKKKKEELEHTKERREGALG